MASFDVFLSHNSKDKPVVRELAEALQDRGLKVWLDEWELVPGRPWQEALEEIIETAKTAAVLVGQDGMGPWEDREMRACLSEFVDRKLPVIPVLLPGAAKQPDLPLFLKAFTWVDLRDGLTDDGLDLYGTRLPGQLWTNHSKSPSRELRRIGPMKRPRRKPLEQRSPSRTTRRTPVIRAGLGHAATSIACSRTCAGVR